MSNKVAISNRQEPVFQGDSEWKEYIIDKNDLNDTVLRLIYEREDIEFVNEYLSKHFKHDKRRKNVYLYVNKDIEGLKGILINIEDIEVLPQILE
jgi:hypothetical protein